MIVKSIIYICVWVAVIIIGYYLICGVAKLTRNPQKPGEGSVLSGCLFLIIVLAGVTLITYIYYALGGENPPLDTPSSRY